MWWACPNHMSILKVKSFLQRGSQRDELHLALNRANTHVVSCQWRGIASSSRAFSSQQLGGKQGLLSYSCKEMNSLTTWMILEANYSLESPKKNEANTIISALWDSEQRTLLHHFWTLIELWGNKWMLFSAAKFVAICYTAIENSFSPFPWWTQIYREDPLRGKCLSSCPITEYCCGYFLGVFNKII